MHVLPLKISIPHGKEQALCPSVDLTLFECYRLDRIRSNKQIYRPWHMYSIQFLLIALHQSLQGCRMRTRSYLHVWSARSLWIRHLDRTFEKWLEKPSDLQHVSLSTNERQKNCEWLIRNDGSIRRERGLFYKATIISLRKNCEKPFGKRRRKRMSERKKSRKKPINKPKKWMKLAQAMKKKKKKKIS